MPAADASSPNSAVAGHLRKEATKQMAIRHAAAVAAASIEKKLASTTSSSETVFLTRQLTEFHRCSLQSELVFLDVLVKMTNEDKLRTLFELFDKDGSGEVSAQEMARSLKKLDAGKSFSQSLDEAILSIAAFDSNNDGRMDIDEFADFLTDLVDAIQCSLNDLSQFLTLRMAFAESGSSVLDAAVIALVQDSTDNSSSLDAFKDAVVEVRMILLFQMMDYDAKGKVKFEEVVKSLYHVTKSMDEIPRKALLMCANDSSNRSLDYPQFASLLLNIVAASSINFHDLANAMTLALCKKDVTKSDMADLFLGDELCKITNMQEQNEHTSEAEVFDALQYGRMTRLFDLWDLDHSGYLDVSEFVLGMRKFHEAKELETTLDESVAAMLSFDKNNDQRLDRNEFATLLARFARNSNVPLHDLIDFMVVTSAVKDNSELERSYIESAKSRVTDQLRRQSSNRESSKRRMGNLWSALRS